MAGQMVACAPHWALLDEALRLELVAAWDQRQAERAAGYAPAASRLRLRDLTEQARRQLELRRAEIEHHAGKPLPPTGLVWQREARRWRQQAAAETGGQA